MQKNKGKGLVCKFLVCKTLVCSYNSKNCFILEWSWLRLLAIRVVEIGAILGQPDAFETKPFESPY